MEFNVPKKFGQLEAGIRNIAASLSSKTPSKGEKEVLDQGLEKLVDTVEQVREGLQDSHNQVVDEFESVLAKLNMLSVTQYGLANQIGLRHDFGKEEGIDTVFDGLRYLEALLTRKESDVESVKVRMERLDQDKRSFQTSRPGLSATNSDPRLLEMICIHTSSEMKLQHLKDLPLIGNISTSR
eukprot:scaffold8446_cov90-Cylindrotheca_fusiformis.AAC.6